MGYDDANLAYILLEWVTWYILGAMQVCAILNVNLSVVQLIYR